MTELIARWNAALNGLVWGPPMLILLVGTGLLLTVLTGAVQFRHLWTALVEVLGKLRKGASSGTGSVTPFQAVATALASTVGVGNIAGVATAIFIGGPGALFWLWVSGVLGMATKFAEIVIALYYREPDANGVMRGGAMYTLKKLGLPWLGTIFALLTALAAFGIGNMVQANSVAESLRASFGLTPSVVGLVLVAVTAVVILGGIKRIAQVTEYLVPFMAIFYLLGGLVILVLRAGDLPAVFGLVFRGAFSGSAAAGGFAGSSIMLAMRYGIARGLFSNEAGLGSAPMVHSAAQTDHPVRQGLYGIFEVFVDTVLICTVTGLVILVTGVWNSGATGAALSAQAFATGLPGSWGHIVVTTGLVLFAYSTIIGWSYYGETGVVYLFGARASLPYRLAWLVFIYLGATGSLHLI
ncbi:MAG: amino acid carrier protein, partial [Gemmatimonadota bacterium]